MSSSPSNTPSDSPQSPNNAPLKDSHIVDHSEPVAGPVHPGARLGPGFGPAPVKPTPAATLKPSESAAAMDRRSFVKWLAIGWVAFAAVMGGYVTLLMRFLFPNVLFEPKQSFRAGVPDDYVVGEVSEKFKTDHGVWIVRDSEKIYVLSTVCTHLGCTPNWLNNEEKFKCPCHGSGFYKTGINFEGPAPRPLERFKVYLTDDGGIMVDKTKKFQQEKGEWSDPESFILV